MFNKAGDLDTEITKRYGIALASYDELRKSVFKSNHINLEAKVKLYNMSVLTRLLWECNNWQLSKSQIKKLESFHFQCLREMMGKTYRDHITVEEVMKATKSERLEFQISMRRLRMVGKIERMDNKLLPKKIMYGTLDHTKIPSATCSGNLIKKIKNPFMSVVQKDLKIFNIEANRFKELASNRKKFNDLIRTSKVEANEKWIKQKEQETRARRQRRQEQQEQEQNIN